MLSAIGVAKSSPLSICAGGGMCNNLELILFLFYDKSLYVFDSQYISK
jgi:hypothetical protein